MYYTSKLIWKNSQTEQNQTEAIPKQYDTRQHAI